MAAQVDRARRGNQTAMDEVVSHHLPLVYNIVGRALNRSADVDDVVQNTMVRVVRGMAGVRDPRRFRSWLVAVTMNEVRNHQKHRQVMPVPSEDIDTLIDAGSDFEDLTLTRLGLSAQRREVVLATRWLDDDHRHLLSLWWLAEAGHLSRADLADALQLSPHHVTVRVARMKAQLDTARWVVRALAARPGCADLIGAASDWDGRPAPVWRKRLVRHIRTCAYCPRISSELVPAERLLAGLALTPVPVDAASQITQQVHAVAGTWRTGAQAGAHAKNTGVLRQVRVAALSAPKSLVGVVAAAALAGGAGLVVTGYSAGPSPEPASAAPAQPSSVASAPASASGSETSAAGLPAPSSSTPDASPAATDSNSTRTKSPAPASSPTITKTPKPTTTPTATRSSTPAEAPTATKPSNKPTGTASSTSGSVSAAEQRLLVLLNDRRSALGLPVVELGTTERRAAESCVKQNLDAGTFEHCGHEVLFASGGNSTPEQMIEAWFNSPGHKAALTYSSSRFAGPAIVFNGSRQIAAINIDY